jgi:Tol biopolymer transport system component
VWGRTNESGDHFYLIDILSGETKIIGKDVLDTYGDGHCSFSQDGRWIVTDTYPDRARHQRLLLYDTRSGRCAILGRFFSPWGFTNSTRCDLHPRWSPDGKWISIDSAYEGLRRTYFVNVAAMVGRIQS